MFDYNLRSHPALTSYLKDFDLFEIPEVRVIEDHEFSGLRYVDLMTSTQVLQGQRFYCMSLVWNIFQLADKEICTYLTISCVGH
jgi:hypothetical protein